jgi:outer membrane receptor protein involved in Fe transport
VPLAVSAVTGEAITSRGLETLAQVTAYIPNVRIAGLDGPAKYVSVRGLGSGNNRGFETSVGLYQDGVYLGREIFLFDSYFDLQRVEAIKGPQGALFGKNTIAGAISVTTAEPADELEGSASFTYGQHDKVEGLAAVSGPFSDALRGRIAVQYFKRGGYIENTFTGVKDGKREVGAGRLKFDWMPSYDLSFKWTLQYADIEQTGTGRQLGTSVPCVSFASAARCAPAAISSPVTAGGTRSLLQIIRLTNPTAEDIPDFRRTNGPQADGEERETLFSSLQADYDVGDHTLTYIGGYGHVPNQVTFLDPDATLFNGGFLINGESFDQHSHELRLVSPVGEFVDYIVGAYYFRSNVGGVQIFQTALGNVAANVDQGTKSTSIFGQATLHPTDELRLIAGGRWINEKKNARLRQAGIAILGFPNYDRNERVSDNKGLLNAAIQYDVTEDGMAYASFTQGYKAGGFNFFDLRNNFPIYEPESSKGYEIGLKSEFLDRTVRLNLAAFLTNFSDLQVSFFNGTALVVGNAATARSKGIEAELNWNLTSEFSLNAATAYTKARFRSYPTGPCTIAQQLNTNGPCVQNLAGRQLERAPDFSAVLNATLDWPVPGMPFNLHLSGDILHTAKYFTAGDLDPASLQPSNTRFNARIALDDQDERWSIALVGKNLNNKEVAYVSANTFQFAGTRFVHVEEARQIDVQLTYRW